MRNWYVIPYVVTDEDDYGKGHIAIVAAVDSYAAQKRMAELARDGDAGLWGEGIVKAYDGSRFERSEEGFFYNSRSCDCGDKGCESGSHETQTVCLRWDATDKLTTHTTLEAAQAAAQRDHAYVETKEFS